MHNMNPNENNPKKNAPKDRAQWISLIVFDAAILITLAVVVWWVLRSG